MPDETKPSPSGSLFNFSLTDFFGAGKGIEKLAATVGAGTGRLADGVSRVAEAKWLSRVDADNEAYHTRVVGSAQTQVLEERLRVITALTQQGQQLESMSISESGVSAQFAGMPVAVQELNERAQRRAAYENVMQQLNRDTVVAHAAVELADEEEVAKNPVDPDWMTRFFRTVQDISSDQLHLIFGKILAGEVRQPGRFSPRLLDFLATLTTEEAAAFQELCAFTWQLNGKDDIILFGVTVEGYTINLPNFTQLQDLRDIGLIDIAHIDSYSYDTSSITLSYNGSAVLIETVPQKDKEAYVEVGIVILTKTGRELARVCQPIFDICIMEYTMQYWLNRGYILSCPIPLLPPPPLTVKNMGKTAEPIDNINLSDK